MHNNEEFENLEELKNNQLDDIILERQDKREQIKKYVILGTAFLLIFLAIVAMVKVLMDSSFLPQDKIVDESIPIYEEGESDFNLESLAVLDQTTEEPPSEEPPAPKQTASESSEPAQVPEPAATPSEPEQPAAKTESGTAPHSSSAAAQPSAPKPVAEVKEKSAEKAAPEPEAGSAPSQEKEEIKIPEFPSIASAQKGENAAQKSEPAAQKSEPAPAAKATQGPAYAIQVGAFLKKDPDPKFLKKIESLGLDYTIKEVRKNGKTIRRVYVGPYPSKEAALKDLKKVRSNLVSSAFVTRLP